VLRCRHNSIFASVASAFPSEAFYVPAKSMEFLLDGTRPGVFTTLGGKRGP
jgi:hypothetical protein